MQFRYFITLILISYLLVLFQTSFLSHFNIHGYEPNLILTAVILLSILERQKNFYSFWLASWGGFFLDIFSNDFIGFHIIILFLTSFFIKIILKKYVRVSFTLKP